VSSPVRAWRAVGGTAPIVVRGDGARVWDADGRSHIDFVGAFGPHLLGHAHPDVVRAIRSATIEGGPFGATHPTEIRLAEQIREAMPSIERLRFTSSGTEAAMSALRVARAATDRKLVLKFAGAYHGHADAMLVRAGSGAATLGVPDSAGVDSAVTAATIVVPFNDLEAAAAAFHSRPGQFAAVIVEPVAANMGLVPPEPDFLEGLRDVTRSDGATLIFDEVITGFRVGRGGAQERYGVVPDLTLLGKVIGGGLPVGAFGGRSELMDLLAPVGPVYQAGTLAGHPLAMAAGEAQLAAATVKVYDRLEDLGQRLESGLRAAIDATAVEASINRVGSLLTVFFRAQPPRDLVEAELSDGAAFGRFHAALWDRGVFIPPSRFESWFISAAHTSEDIDGVVGAAHEAFAAANSSEVPT